ncbi:manganese efflux pump MntP [Alicyclobacillus suci]|uniref:manganese efflux pump MntP n=1 Tax=Alicyclobacillus suci TaxID=2816080 RepID=UPI001A8DAB0F|nr:manganese efflux pump [Alicyclobacillus suci]
MTWNTFIALNLVGVGSNFDNTGIGMAYGADKVRMPHWVNGLINLIGGLIALVGAYAGNTIAQFLSASEANWITCIALSGIGLFFWYAAYLHPHISKNKAKIKVASLGLRQAFLLGLAMSLDNIVIGFGSSISNTPAFWAVAVSITVWGYIMLWIGHMVGLGVLSKFLGKYSALIAGGILIGVGVNQLVR